MAFNGREAINWNSIAVVTGLLIGSYYTYKDGRRDIKLADSRDQAILADQQKNQLTVRINQEVKEENPTQITPIIQT